MTPKHLSDNLKPCHFIRGNFPLNNFIHLDNNPVSSLNSGSLVDPLLSDRHFKSVFYVLMCENLVGLGFTC